MCIWRAGASLGNTPIFFSPVVPETSPKSLGTGIYVGKALSVKSLDHGAGRQEKRQT